MPSSGTDLYFGLCRGQSPPNPYYQNPAIIPPNSPLQVDGDYLIGVTLKNYGYAKARTTEIHLYWDEPTNNPQAKSDRLIKKIDLSEVAAANRPRRPNGSFDGRSDNAVCWTVPTDVSAYNGYVCYLARAVMTAEGIDENDTLYPPQQWTDPAYADPLSAIHNVFVVRTAISSVGGTGSDDGRSFRTGFAFTALHTLKKCKETELKVRPLDPQKDRARIKLLTDNRSVKNALSRLKLKFMLPKTVFFARGREEVKIPTSSLNGNRIDGPIPRIGRLGPLDPQGIAELLPPGKQLDRANKPLLLKSAFGVMYQSILALDVSPQTKGIYAVEVEEVGPDRHLTGGLTCVFIVK